MTRSFITNWKSQGWLGLMFYLFVTGCAPVQTDYTLPVPAVQSSNTRPAAAPGVHYIPSGGGGAIAQKLPAYALREWLPPANLESKGRWVGILIHHSATIDGDAASFDAAHRYRGWDSLGYHFVVDNGRNAHAKANGAVEVGGRWKEQKYGAHCRIDPKDDNRWNERYIGICLVGDFEKSSPTAAQYDALVRLVAFLQDRYAISARNVMGHGQVPGAATKCPGRNFSWSEFKRRLASVKK